jgi:PAS domain S-box-containing protein
MNVKFFEEKFKGVSQNLQKLGDHAQNLQEQQQALLTEIMNEFSKALETFRLTSEKLQQQNEELASMRKSLEEERNHRQSLFESSPRAQLKTDLAGKIIEANQTAGTWFRMTPGLLVGKMLTQFALPDRQKSFGDFLLRLAKEERDQEWEAPFKVEEGETLQLVLLGRPHRESDGKLTFFHWMLQDVTPRLKLEEDLAKAQKLESLGIVAGGIAHDFNNLLSAIGGNVSLAKLYLKPEEKVFGLLEKAEKASQQATNLTKELMSLSNSGAQIKKRAFLGKLIKETAQISLSNSNVQGEFHIPDDLWPIEVNEGQIRQVIHNFVLNAKEAMPTGGVVTIQAKNITIRSRDELPLREGKYLKISIEDQGVGIPAENLSRIFEPFFTTKDRNGQKETTGLGLAICHSIIKAHDGFITVESEEGVGTTFQIYFPVALKEVKGDNEDLKEIAPEPPKEALRETRGEGKGEGRKETSPEGLKEAIRAIARKVPQEPLKEVPAAVVEIPPIGQGRVLVMDDEEMVRDIAGKILTHMGLEVEFAKDGVEAIALYRKAMETKNPFDAVILDLTIPGGMGAKETVKKLLEIDPQAKAILSSGYSNDPIIERFRQFGFKDVVAKPYRVSELSQRVANVMEAAV